MDEGSVDAEAFAPQSLHDAIAHLGKFGEDREDGPRSCGVGQLVDDCDPRYLLELPCARAPAAGIRGDRRGQPRERSGADPPPPRAHAMERNFVAKLVADGADRFPTRERAAQRNAVHQPQADRIGEQAVADHLNQPEELDPRAGRREAD